MKDSSAILSEKTDRENHNTTMGRNEISFLLSGSAILTSFSLKFAFHTSDKGSGSLQNVNCEEGTYYIGTYQPLGPVETCYPLVAVSDATNTLRRVYMRVHRILNNA